MPYKVRAMIIEISPKKILFTLLFIITFLLFANLSGIVSRIYFDHDYVYGLVNLFDFNSEMNIPTFYSAMALFFTSNLLLLISNLQRKTQNPYILWIILSVIFLFLSVDEISSIHERLNFLTRDLLGTSGFLYYAWVIPYAIVLCVFVILYLKFLLLLPRKIMMLFLLSGSIFVSGALGFEMVGAWQSQLHGSEGLLYSILYTCEEVLEMLGIAIFIYTLLEYILSRHKHLEITLIENSRATNKVLRQGL